MSLKRDREENQILITFKCGNDIHIIEESLLKNPNGEFLTLITNTKVGVKKENDAYLIDCDPKIFSIIINYLKNKQNVEIFMDKENRDGLIEWLDYFCMNELSYYLHHTDVVAPKKEQVGCFVFKENEKYAIKDRTRNLSKYPEIAETILFPIDTNCGYSFDISYCIKNDWKPSFIGIYFISNSERNLSTITYSPFKNDLDSPEMLIYKITDSFFGLEKKKDTWQSVFGLYDSNIEDVDYTYDMHGFNPKFKVPFGEIINIELIKGCQFRIKIESYQDTPCNEWEFNGIGICKLCIIMKGYGDIVKIPNKTL
jgi:hypothetical protein